MAVMSKDSGAWLQALPVSSLGLRLDDNSLCIAVGLYLGTPLGKSHQCQNCGTEVDVMGQHAPSCKRSTGKQQCHGAFNDVIHCALLSSQVPACLEPVGLSRSDGKWPDGATLVPWKSRKPLIWDATCVDTLAPSYRNLAVTAAGAVACKKESLKEEKYADLSHSHIFAPVAIETAGTFGSHTLSFIKELGKCLRGSSRDDNATRYLIQGLSMVVQRCSCGDGEHRFLIISIIISLIVDHAFKFKYLVN